MRTAALLLLVALTTLAEHLDNRYSRLAKREVLLRSKRRWVLSTIEVVEEDPGPFPKQISQMFNDKFKEGKGHKFSISGHGVDKDPTGVFSIDVNNGKVYAHKAIDRETLDRFHIKFDVLDRDLGTRLDKELAFDVEIKDINDNAPLFDHRLMRATVKESTPEGYLPVQLRATDKDQENTPNSTLKMSVLSQTPDEPKFTIDQFDDRNGQLQFTGCFNYDNAKMYNIIVEAKDQGTPPLSSSATILLTIDDSNTHLPVFKEKTYNSEVLEMSTKEGLLRIAVEDKDKPNTPGWRAKYYFVKGNEDGNYKIETDPKTNEGILSIIKGKDYERTTFTNVQIGVENEEKLFVCPGKAPAETSPPSTVDISIKVIDVNDPPSFDKDTADIYQKEEELPGKVLFVPLVHDVDSDVDKIRFELKDDPAGWVTIDPKTGTITSAKKMDRESPFVKNNVYKVLMTAIDDGEPPATGTCTVKVHLGDINDHVPALVNGTLIMCGNKNDKVTVAVTDQDANPFSGPFAYSLGGKDKALKQRWKLDPAFGEEAVLISLKSLPYGNYSVPLLIQDQQNMIGQETLYVVVCNCGKGEECLKKDPLTVNLGGAAIGLIIGGLLLFLLLLLLFMCQCGKHFQTITLKQDEGNQTLIKYNQEGGSSECKAEPSLLLGPTTTMTVTDSVKQSNTQHVMGPPLMTEEYDIYTNTMYSRNNEHYMSGLGAQNQRESMRNGGGWNKYSTYHTNRSTMRGASRFGRSFSTQANQQIEDHLYRKIQTMAMNNVDDPLYNPYEYAYEGDGSRCQSLDKLSLSNWGDDLQFLNNLGPKFKTLGGICQQTILEKNIQL